ncbi:hypothetical protein DM860_003703 [Cuscuta australis]|uniref:Uncharacterized protein n=1 Tax=Cuscuta australis TaxID=267555 RepID=A0A328DHG9_9ASTE|nr:hypothetical protein DM860_003703 [Cuscuta australis]
MADDDLRSEEEEELSSVLRRHFFSVSKYKAKKQMYVSIEKIFSRIAFVINIIHKLCLRPEPLSTFEKDWVWHVPEELALLSMQNACWNIMISVPLEPLHARKETSGAIMYGLSDTMSSVIPNLEGTRVWDLKKASLLSCHSKGMLFSLPSVQRILEAETVTAASPTAPSMWSFRTCEI